MLRALSEVICARDSPSCWGCGGSCHLSSRCGLRKAAAQQPAVEVGFQLLAGVFGDAHRDRTIADRPVQRLEAILCDLVQHRRLGIPRPVDAIGDLHSQPEAGGRGAGRNTRRTLRLRGSSLWHGWARPGPGGASSHEGGPMTSPSRSRTVRPGSVLRTFLALSLLAALPAAAQNVTITLRGRVSDEQGGALPGATITARNVETSSQRGHRRPGAVLHPQPAAGPLRPDRGALRFLDREAPRPAASRRTGGHGRFRAEGRRPDRGGHGGGGGAAPGDDAQHAGQHRRQGPDRPPAGDRPGLRFAGQADAGRDDRHRRQRRQPLGERPARLRQQLLRGRGDGRVAVLRQAVLQLRPGLDPGVPGDDELLPGGVRHGLGRHHQRHHAQREQRVPRPRLRVLPGRLPRRGAVRGPLRRSGNPEYLDDAAVALPAAARAASWAGRS